MRRLISKLIKNPLPFFVFLLGLTPLIWFWQRPGILINGSDTNFPLDPMIWFKRRLFVWHSVANAGSDFSSSTAGLFFHLIQVVPHQLGFSLQTVQIISLIFWFLLIVFSAYFFARTLLPKKVIAQLIFVVFYSFNIYLFNTWENVKVANLALVSALPAALAVLVSLEKGKLSHKAAVFYSIAVGLVLSGSGINPAYFLSFFLILFLYFVSSLVIHLEVETMLKKTKDFLLVSLLILLTNAFWILPTANYVFKNISASESLSGIGYTNWVDSLSKNTSILNVARLQGAWDWYSFDSLTGQPLYIPYAPNYFHRLPFLVFSFLILTLVLVSLLVRDNKRHGLYLFFALSLVLGIFLGVGTHSPTGIIFSFLSRHLPFFSLFRSPWYIFTPMLTLSYAGLLALFFGNIKKTIFVSVGALIMIVGNFLYTYPLITGKIFRPAMEDNFLIKFPSYVFDAQKWLSKQDITKMGRVVGYPRDDIERFSWGYNGIDSILGLLSNAENLFSPLNASGFPVAPLISEFYEKLNKGEIESAQNLAAKLNVGLIFHKGDQESLAFDLIEAAKTRPIGDFGQWHFYSFPFDGVYLPKIYSPNKLFFGHAYKSGEKLMGSLAANELLINPADSVVGGIPTVSLSAGRAVLAENSQAKALAEFSAAPHIFSNRLLNRDLFKVDFIFDIPESGFYQPALERYKLEDFGILPGSGLEVVLDDKKTTWMFDRLSDSYVYFIPVEFQGGTHTVSLDLENRNLVDGGNFEEGERFFKDGDGEFRVDHELSILNKSDRDISANLEITPFDSLLAYYIKVRYKQVYGDLATALVSQGRLSGSLLKTQAEAFPNYPEWGVFSFFFEPVRTDSKAQVQLVAPRTKDDLGTKVLYDDLEVYKVFTNELMFTKEAQQLSSPQISFDQVSPVKYEGEVTGTTGPHLIVFSETYSPQWQLKIKSVEGEELPILAKHFSANLYANAWYVEGAPRHYQIEIYYQPQVLKNIGLIISGAGVVLGAVIFLENKMRRQNVEK